MKTVSLLIIGLCNIAIGCSLAAATKKNPNGKSTKIIALANIVLGIFLIALSFVYGQ